VPKRFAGVRASRAAIPARGTPARRTTQLRFFLRSPARVVFTVFGPGPGCELRGLFSAPGRAGYNQVPFRGRVAGRALAPGRYLITSQAVRGDSRRALGRLELKIGAGGEAPRCGNPAAAVLGSEATLVSFGDSFASAVGGALAAEVDEAPTASEPAKRGSAASAPRRPPATEGEADRGTDLPGLPVAIPEIRVPKSVGGLPTWPGLVALAIVTFGALAIAGALLARLVTGRTRTQP
jgi:hypothetical protein